MASSDKTAYDFTATDIDGRPRSLSEFAVDGAGKLTGTMNNEFFGATPIKDGVVNGNAISFKLTFEGAPDGGAMTINYTGTVKGDELAMTSKFQGEVPGGGPAEMSFTATRAK